MHDVESSHHMGGWFACGRIATAGVRHHSPFNPSHLWRSIFEDEAVAELLTTGKLSELAVLTLYLM